MIALRINFENENYMHFVTITVIEWIDIITKAEYFNIIIDSLKYCQANKGLKIFEYVIMPNHIHLIIKAKDGYKLSEIIRDFKRHTTRAILCQLESDNRRYILNLIKNNIKRVKGNKKQIWQRENYPEFITSDEFYLQKANYIRQNPVRKKFVINPEDWLYSSAKIRLSNNFDFCPLDLDDL